MKKIFLVTISLILSIFTCGNIVFANQPDQPTTPGKCSQISIDNEHFYVILEEPISNEGFICFRECIGTTLENEQKVITNCSLKDSCGTGDDVVSCQRVQVLESRSGAELIYTYIGTIYKWAAGTIGIVSVLIIVFSGIQIMAAGGDSDAIGNAKKRIIQSLTGLAILLLSGLILYTINPTFFV